MKSLTRSRNFWNLRSFEGLIGRKLGSIEETHYSLLILSWLDPCSSLLAFTRFPSLRFYTITGVVFSLYLILSVASHFSWVNGQCSYELMPGLGHPFSFTLHCFLLTSAATLTFVWLIEYIMVFPHPNMGSCCFFSPSFHLINSHLSLEIKLKCHCLQGIIPDHPF